MLGKLFGKNEKPGPPKNQVEVVCPICGAAQYEPRIVVTTFCRKCGEHLRIEKKKVVASSQLNPVPSALYPSEAHPPTPREQPKPSDFRERQPQPEAKPPVALGAMPAAPSATAGSGQAPSKIAPLGLGQMMGLGDSPPAESLDQPAPADSPAAGGIPAQRSRQRSQTPARLPDAANEGAPPQAPMTASTLQKMKEQGYYRQQYFKDVECFDCHHKFKVGRSAKSTNCPTCGAYICLEDFDINVPSTTPIRTRGDVIIRKNGNISTAEIICRDLRIFGIVAAKIDCSGEVAIKTSGTIIGEIRCRKFTIEKGSDIHLINTVHASEVEVGARVSGNIRCDGPVNISSHGWVHGDVTARAVSIEPGGQLDGAMNIVRGSAGPSQSPVPVSPPP